MENDYTAASYCDSDTYWVGEREGEEREDRERESSALPRECVETLKL